MRQRIKTALILIVIVAIAMFGRTNSSSPVLFVPLLLVGGGISAHEFTKLMPKWESPFLFVMATLLVLAGSMLVPAIWAVWWGLSLVFWAFAVRWVLVYPAKECWYGRRLAFMGLIMLTAAITAMLWLWLLSPWWLLYVFLLV